MELWWTSLGTASQVFYAIALTSSLVLVVQLVLMALGFDGDADADADFDGDLEHGGGVHVLSVRTVTAFFVGFGWTGVTALDAGWGLPAALLAAIAVGGLFMGGVLYLMRALYSLRHSGTLDYRNAVGEIGTVYLRVPAAMAAPGQVEVMVQGRLRVVQAFTRAERELPNRSRVKVVDIMDQNTLVVEPFEGQTAAS